MLDRARHEYYLKRILRDMIAESELASGLALKGGTCLYLFYGLPRLSVDLDFNLIGKGFEVEVVNKVLRRYVNVEGGFERVGMVGCGRRPMRRGSGIFR